MFQLTRGMYLRARHKRNSACGYYTSHAANTNPKRCRARVAPRSRVAFSRPGENARLGQKDVDERSLRFPEPSLTTDCRPTASENVVLDHERDSTWNGETFGHIFWTANCLVNLEIFRDENICAHYSLRILAIVQKKLPAKRKQMMKLYSCGEKWQSRADIILVEFSFRAYRWL